MKKKKIIETPFDRFREPPRQNAAFVPLVWGFSWCATRSGRLKIKKTCMEGLKPPFLVLGSHHSFMDFYITPLALFPHRANYISELEGFENFGEWLYRQVGCLGTRKFVNDMALVKNIRRVVDRGDIIVIYPEARYANVGTNSVLPDSVGKLAKALKVPVVTINMKGNYLQSPIWNLKKRSGVRLETKITQIFTKEELALASVDEVQEKIQEQLTYDEYQWQIDQQMHIDYPERAEGLELVLYQCRNCHTEFKMRAEGASLFCEHCGSQWYMTELGQLEEKDGSGELIHIPDWYEWEREQVVLSINEGRYKLELPVQIDSLPNAKNFIDLGEGSLLHNEQGFSLTVVQYGEKEESTLLFSSKSLFSIHTEYDYRGKGQCITLSTVDNTYFIFPKGDGFNATKIQFATEALFGK